MKTTVLATGVAIALATLTTGTVLAQTSTRPAPAMRADADGDRRISRAEFIDGRISRMAAIDANRDGLVSPEERQSGRDTRRTQRVSARFETLDKDGNGAIDREEFAAGDKMQGERTGRGGRHGAGNRHGDRRGGAGDRPGTTEPVSIAEARTRVTAVFDRIDADRDGFITVEERRAGRAEMRDQRRSRRNADQPSPSATASE
ncbi:EF-hand domain-containing protein [Brevundimonas sp. R86498]|uniref:EF-hand domain-containing protein n=1 Tax=Brevundimonas sp. R86498 TaxID=3093845 RepID=UPI0037C6D931